MYIRYYRDVHFLSYTGFYECIGSNTAGEDIKTAQLIYAGIHVKLIILIFKNISQYLFIERPVVSVEQSHILISPGDDVFLTCNVLGETYPDIRWLKDNQLVNYSNSVFKLKFVY